MRRSILRLAALATASITASCGGDDSSQGTADGGQTDGTIDAALDRSNGADAPVDAFHPPLDGGYDATTGDAGGDAPADAGVEATTDGGIDATTDAGLDASSDTGADAGFDAGADAPTDAGADALGDSSIPDGGSDAPADVGPTDAGCRSIIGVVAGGTTTSALAFQQTGGAWSSASALGATLASTPALIPYGGGFIGAAQAGSNALASTVYSGSGWTSLAQIASAATNGSPSLTALGAGAHVVYLGTDFKFYHGTYSGAGWDAANDKVGIFGDGGGVQSFGNSPPTVASVGTMLDLAQAGTDTKLYDQVWDGTSWQVANAHTGIALDPTISPTILALTGGNDDLMIVFASQTTQFLFYLTRNASSGVWTSPTMLFDVNTFSPFPVSMAPTPGGGAVLAFQGGDGKGYYMTYRPAGDGPWAAAQPLFATGNPSLLSPPQVATGVCGAVGNLVLVGAFSGTDNVQVTAFDGSVWGTAVTLPGTIGSSYAAIATLP